MWRGEGRALRGVGLIRGIPGSLCGIFKDGCVRFCVRFLITLCRRDDRSFSLLKLARHRYRVVVGRQLTGVTLS